MNEAIGAGDQDFAPTTEPRVRRGRRGFRFSDFDLRDGKVTIRKTGNSATIDHALLHEVATWVAFYLVVRCRELLRGLARGPRPSIWFTPDVPHPRYLVRAAAIWGGVALARSPAEADAAFFFEDTTVSLPHAPAHARHFNFACRDISKGHVAAVFADVFGYPLAVEPAQWSGDAVEKSEVNGAHDGRLVRCPRPATPGRTYQKLVDNIRADGFAYDLRTHCIAGRVVAVCVKRRSPEARFLPPNLAVVPQAPEAVFSAVELDLIATFVRAMGADWCALDILRDEPSGLIYVVDVNKTDAGPITALSLRQKLAAMAILARSLRAMLDGRETTAN